MSSNIDIENNVDTAVSTFNTITMNNHRFRTQQI